LGIGKDGLGDLRKREAGEKIVHAIGVLGLSMVAEQRA